MCDGETAHEQSRRGRYPSMFKGHTHIGMVEVFIPFYEREIKKKEGGC